ncbi:protein disulfide-isomerase A3-like [Symsagittifera roscoffensis]|uniref:protein disulfide-isomerase A3-like n=1 Tax=Symsagittifera roscoffensis TaxID=84072 RepID=UPI00307C820B
MNGVVCIFVSLVALVFASDVIELSDSTFESVIEEKEIILVEFFAPWCGHCKKLAPEYEKAATALLKNDPPIPLAKVDCTEAGKESCSKFGVSGYPTLKVFRGIENIEDYSGPREASGIISYMKSKAGPAAKELKTVEDLTKIQASDEVYIIGFFKEGSSLSSAFASASNKLRDNFKLALTTSEEVIKAASATAETVTLYRPKRLITKLEESSVTLTDASANSAQISSFVKDNFSGLTGHLTPDNGPFFKKPQCVAYYQVDYLRNPKGTNYYRNRVMKVAKKFEGKLTFAVASKEDFSGELGEMGIESSSEDVNVVIWSEKGQKFRMDPSITFSMEALEKFAQDYLDGKIEPYLKSEEPPADNSGPVKVVTAKTFDEIVNDAERDVLIEFYAPWCGHCKSLAPKYDELGEKLTGEDSVVIAKMDATANDVPPPYNVRGFPTIYWAPKGKKDSPKKYEGAREVKDFLSFIKKESSNKLKDEL